MNSIFGSQEDAQDSPDTADGRGIADADAVDTTTSDTTNRDAPDQSDAAPIAPSYDPDPTECDFFASPEGNGDGLAQSSPMKVSEFWAVAAPGMTLCLLDGHYRGRDSMIRPPEELAGTADAPIRVWSLHDGGAWLDGEGVRESIDISGSSWIEVRGVDVCCSTPADWEDVYYNSSASVQINGGASNIKIQRVNAWDGGFGVHHATDVLLEDVAAWGLTRKVFSGSQHGDRVTIRRSWGRWEGWDDTGPKMTYTIAYNNYDMILENALATWTQHRLPESYVVDCPDGTVRDWCDQTYSNSEVPSAYGLFAMDRQDDSRYCNSSLLGSIAYIEEPFEFAPERLVLMSKLEGVTLRDVVAYVPPGAFPDKRPIELHSSRGEGRDLIGERLVAIGGKDSHFDDEWQTSDVSTFAEAPADSATFTMAPGICKRYVDGVLTDEPLWPWPMEERIAKALVRSGQDPISVTASIESMLGAIPAECKSY